MVLHRIVTTATDVLPGPDEPPSLTQRRRRLLASATGRVLEVGGSGGRNVPHYPADQVDLVVTLSPAGARRHRLMDRIAASPVRVEVHEAVAEEVRFEDGWFDTVVSTLALCCVPDAAATLASMRRMLKSDGKLLLLEHVLVPGLTGTVQRAITPAWHRLGGCRLDRDVLAEVRAAGFAVTDCERFNVVGLPLVPDRWVQAIAQPARTAAPAGDAA